MKNTNKLKKTYKNPAYEDMFSRKCFIINVHANFKFQHFSYQNPHTTQLSHLVVLLVSNP